MMLLEVAQEVKWIWSFLEELRIVSKLLTVIYEDNQAAITYASNSCTLSCMKHIDVMYHFMCHLIEAGIIKLLYRSSEEMTVDVI
jgi:hypothetical protein